MSRGRRTGGHAAELSSSARHRARVSQHTACAARHEDCRDDLNRINELRVAMRLLLESPAS